MGSKKISEHIPKVRFSNFKEQWKEVKLKDITQRITRKNKNLESDRPLTISAEDGLVDQRTYFDKQIASKNMSNYYLLEKGDFAYNKSYSKGYPMGAIKRLEKYEHGTLSTLYFVFRPNEQDVDSDYFVAYFDHNIWHKEVTKIAAEGARNHGLLNIPVNDFFKIDLMLPELAEQEKIGKLFKTLDNLISAQEKQVLNLEQYKKAMLQKLLPLRGENIPELRFEKFDNKWREEKLGNLLQYEQPTKYLVDSDDYDDSYTTPVLTAGQSFILGYTNETHGIYDKDKMILFDDFTTATQLVDFPFKVKSSATKFLTPTGVNDIHFLHETLNRVQYPTNDHKRYWISEYSTLKVVIPSIQEQKMIGNFFKTFDDQIVAQKRKLKKYKTLKQGLLQKMFV